MIQCTNQDIKNYYRKNQKIYNLFWSKTDLHYGLWYAGTKNLAEAILNTNKFVVNILDINSKDVVLDAGCGVGGTSIYIVKNKRAKVEGITLSKLQLEVIKNKVSKLEKKEADLLNFSEQDFTKTNFKTNAFSKVLAIESICHAHNKIDFLKEAYRVMISGGKIAVVDAFLIKKELTPKERKIYTKFLEGWRLPNLLTKDEFLADLVKTGFRKIVFHDKLKNIKKSSKILYYMGLLMYPFGIIKSKIGAGVGNFSAFYQKKLFEGIATYGIFIAEK